MSPCRNFVGTVAWKISLQLFNSRILETAADYIASTMGGACGLTVTATVDAGLISDLYRSTPICALVRSGAGVDMDWRALPGSFDASSDVQDFTTRVPVVRSGEKRFLLQTEQPTSRAG